MINLIVASDLDFGIGINNQLPWKIPKELEFFNRITQNATLLMGLKTYLSLPKTFKTSHRKIVVVSAQKNFFKHLPISKILKNTEEAVNFLKKYRNSKDILFICGGESIYQQFYRYAQKIYISVIQDKYKTDAKINFIQNNELTDDKIIYKDNEFISYLINRRNDE
ncbi:dihydrofolate reductase [Mycoplasmopsis mustelae]|uniref:dihydrofolate reductase n=1 Tax=Mycoplasmopsis mustelae TaxID=171289 RepID=A0A4R7UDF0_9BACT|nr:dihydrofolate reductase [Mycoplasmopsis mustelae]TDV24066.1 dihydrofolate reductase [Mycoplasmopsis mustelae]